MAPMKSAARAFFLSAGLFSLALGLIGAALPLLPTVPFLLLAAYCFARSSERLHRWLVEHPRLGPPILAWSRHGVISPGAKALALLSLAGSVGLAFWGTAIPWARAGASAAAVLVSLFLLTRPSRTPEERAFPDEAAPAEASPAEASRAETSGSGLGT